MMIKCQKCGFENQMGSIFCRECGEKLDMDAIDPNKLQKDVDKEKNIKRAKKRIKEAISTGIGILVVVAFIFVVFPDLFPFGNLRQYEEPAVTEASANQKFSAAVSGSTVGKVKYSYPELTRMFNAKVVAPLSEMDSFAKVTNAEIAYDEEKNQPVVYLWISIKEKVPVVYTIRGDLIFNSRDDSSKDVTPPLSLDVKRLDIGRLPLFVSTHTFLEGFAPLMDNEEIMNFFARAKDVSFGADGMTVEFEKGSGAPSASSSSYVPKASASAGVAALKGGSTAALSEKDEAAREAAKAKAEAAKQKAEEEAEKKKALEEERKRKAEEYRQQQKEKEEERKRKAEEEKERKKQEAEEKKRQAEEEAERRRQEREDRRRDRDNNNYNSRNSRSSRSSRNRY